LIRYNIVDSYSCLINNRGNTISNNDNRSDRNNISNNDKVSRNKDINNINNDNKMNRIKNKIR